MPMARTRFALLGLFLTSLSALAAAEGRPDSQDSLTPLVNAGGKELTFDWPAFRIGTAEYAEGPTGVTVFHFPKKAFVAIDARGGGPGTINAKHIELGYPEAELDSITLAGGSWYGLEAATAVGSAIKEDGLRNGDWDDVALATGSIIYDLGPRRLNEIVPDKRLAQAAFRAAKPNMFRLGAAGAGRMAKTGGIFGCRAHGGQGAAFRQIGELKIAVFTVVNAYGVLVDRQNQLAACYRDPKWPANAKVTDLMGALPATFSEGWVGQPLPGGNTTISVVVVNQKMDPAQLNRLAAQVHTSMSRAIQPFATISDGDVLYAVSTAEYDPGEENAGLNSMQIGVVASEMMWDAILASIPEQPKRVEAVERLTVAPATLRHYAGDYRFSSFVSLRVTERNGRLFAQATGERDVFAITRAAPTEILPVSSSLFTVPGRYPLTVSFADRGMIVINPGSWQQIGAKR